jgi:hypothetical protein
VTAAATAGPELPLLVRRYLERSLPPQLSCPQRVRISQHGQMWQKPGRRALSFTASQVLAVDRVGFSWRARFPLVGPIAIKVVDAYADGLGELEARVLGVRVMHQDGPETTAGEALRYLAELPWVPFAILGNHELEWRELDGRRVEVATHLGTKRVAVALRFDQGGDVVTATAERPYPVGREWVPMGWTGQFGDYERLGGVRIPTAAEVRWELPEGAFTYWRGAVDSLELDPGRGNR